MKVLLTVVGLLAFCHAKNLVDYRVALSKTAEKPKNCTSAGLLCETCTTLVACIDNGDDTYTKNTVKTCPSGEKCVKSACTAEPEPFCDGTADLDFLCQAVGIFPDPFYCNKFVLCVQVKDKLQAYSNQCEEGLGYNIGSGLCDVILDEGVCPEINNSDDYPIPLCKEAGQSEPLKNKPQEYYKCKEYSSTKSVLYPVISVCPKAETYNNYICLKA